MNFAVVGAKGFIGRHLVAGLSSEGHRVYSYSSKDTGPFDSKSGIFDSHFTFPENLEAVFYLAQSPFYRMASSSLQHIYNVNTLGAALAARAAKKAGAKTFVYASTGNVYAPTFLPMAEDSQLNLQDAYALSKIHAEQLLEAEAKEIDILCLRLFGVFGTQQSDMLVSKIRDRVISGMPVSIEKNPVDPEDKDGIRISYLYVQDLIRILLAMVRSEKSKGYQCLNIAGPRAVSLKELTLTLAAALGKEPIIQYPDKFRQTDLVAEISLLERTIPLNFTPFDSAIRALVEKKKTGLYEFKDGGIS